MPSVISHAFAASIVGASLFGRAERWRVACVAAACSMFPDLDVVGFRYDIAYEDMLGHRGLSHSLAFAALVASLATVLLFRGARWRPLRLRVFLLLFAATASHGLLDAMTDGGLGVAFFAPFDSERYFLPFRPIEVSPIGVKRFLSERGLRILANEGIWIWLPATLSSVMLLALSSRRSER